MYKCLSSQDSNARIGFLVFFFCVVPYQKLSIEWCKNKLSMISMHKNKLFELSQYLEQLINYSS